MQDRGTCGFWEEVLGCSVRTQIAVDVVGLPIASGVRALFDGVGISACRETDVEDDVWGWGDWAAGW